MPIKTNTIKQIVLASLTAAGLSQFAVAGDLSNLPRGANVGVLAGNCNIGPFPQTSKAGPYNNLCDIMQDAEKCLGFVKRQIHFTGENVIVSPVSSSEKDKGRYCLEVLKRDLGLGLGLE